MFKNKWCVLIKEKSSNKKHLKKLNQFWKRIGCKIVIMNTKQHDHIFAITSHLPHLIAYNIVKTALDFEKKRKLNLIKFSGRQTHGQDDASYPTLQDQSGRILRRLRIPR